MAAVVILGMHRSGTTLVAAIAEALGVDLGEYGPDGLHEDDEIRRLNFDILAAAGGDWCHPPSQARIAAAGAAMRKPLAFLIAARQKRATLWGWKDPRTVLTAYLYHSHLNQPRYVVIRRNTDDVVRSLRERWGEDADDWGQLVNLYHDRLDQFLSSMDAPVCELRYEYLVKRDTAEQEVRKLADFLGIDGDLDNALACIRYQDSRDWGRLGIGVPYYRPNYEFFQWWSYLIASGFRPGDSLLNNRNVPAELPLPLTHNAIVREFLRHEELQTLCIIEDDHCGEIDIIERMRTKPVNFDFDIVCASYPNRRLDYPVCIGCNFAEGEDEVNDYGEYGLIIHPFHVERTGTQEYDCAALGCVLIRRWVLEAMLGDADPADFFWFDWYGRNSPDVRFYWRARKLGARVGVDRDNCVGHIGKHIWTMEDFFEKREELRMKLEAEGKSVEEALDGNRVQR